MKKIFLMTTLLFTVMISYAGDDQDTYLRKLLNRKITFPEKVELTQKESIEVQFEIMPDGCVALTAAHGNPEIINYVATKIENMKVPYIEGNTNVFVYKFTFEKEK